MKAVIVYESMFGNTHAVAEAIADGMSEHASVDLVNAADVTEASLDAADLVVIGAPTHKHGLPDPTSRRQAVAWSEAHSDSLRCERSTPASGIRDFLGRFGDLARRAAAFDTRTAIDPVLSGAASQDVDRALEALGADRVAAPESFLVSTSNRLVDGEWARARSWGEHLAERACTLRALDPAGAVPPHRRREGVWTTRRAS